MANQSLEYSNQSLVFFLYFFEALNDAFSGLFFQGFSLDLITDIDSLWGHAAQIVFMWKHC